MRYFNSKWRVIITITLMILVICTVFSLLLIYHNQKCLNDSIALQAESIRTLALSIENENSVRYRQRIRSFVKRADLLSPFAARNREELLRRSNPYLTALRDENRFFSTIAWLLPDHYCFLRVHRPDDFGDIVTEMRPDIVMADREKRQVAGYKIGKSGLQYRIVQPAFHDSEYIGLAQFGINGEFLLRSIEERLKVPMGLVFSSEKNRFLGQPELPTLEGRKFTIQSQHNDLFAGRIDEIDWEAPTKPIRLQNQLFMIFPVLDLADFSGATEGRLFAAIDITERSEKVGMMIVFAVMLSLLITLLSFLVLNASYGSLMERILALNRSLEQSNRQLEQRVHERTIELQEKNKRLERLSTTDVLTGIFNRMKLDNILKYEQVQAKRYGKDLSVILIDIDFFKKINDEYGHLTGDEVLIEFVAVVKENTRAVDSFGRWGGEEFLLICPSISRAGAFKIAEKIRSTVANHKFAKVGTLTASFGIAAYEPGDTVSGLIKKADDALYSAKERRNSITII